MSFPEYLRKLARRCLRLSKTAVEPELIERCRYGRWSWRTRRTKRSAVPDGHAQLTGRRGTERIHGGVWRTDRVLE